MRRRWFAHRQAYAPRFWIWTAVSGGLAVSIVLLLEPGVLGAIAIGLGIGVGVTQVVWWRWRRRHPVIGVEELLERQREAARWN